MTEMPLGRLVGHDLDMVSFVRDYVELRIDYCIVRALTDPSGRIGDAGWRLPEHGAADILRRYIGLTVIATEVVEDDHLSLHFEGDAHIDVSLRPNDRVGPEAAHFVPSFPGTDRLDLAAMWVW
ncbi:MAG: hypothetical protein ABI658_18605 [Acidimicrobiales bacterium]